MNKSELVAVVVNQLNNEIKKQDVERVLNSFLDVMRESLLNRQKISFKGFITLDVKLVEEKQGILDGKAWATPKKYIPKAKYSSVFKKQMADRKV